MRTFIMAVAVLGAVLASVGVFLSWWWLVLVGAAAVVFAAVTGALAAPSTRRGR
ncbi:hypothetical protein [Actinoplanes sp. ATCC 53533]|uniref:hypothetical protein n=1 Tax=Actinoplanes sp. ATCC 53533 TaxID=1288362 RepID=UPI0013153979|nr:hypothetical protein [Actinoplanes sp. ATCC 53533]